MAEAAPPAAVARLATRLKIGKSIGVGGFAVVYRAVLDGRTVALKVLLPAHANSARSGRDDCPISMFLREGQCLKQHPHR